jgi:hypothetical protein
MSTWMSIGFHPDQMDLTTEPTTQAVIRGSCEVAGTPMLATPIKNTTRVSRSRSTSGISAVEIARQAREDMT